MSYSSSKASNIQSLSNAISYSPILNIGDGNESDSASNQTAEQTATASLKDEVTASVGVGVGGDGSGGAVAKSGADIQPMSMTDANNFMQSNSQMLLIVGVGIFFGGYILFKKKKRK